MPASNVISKPCHLERNKVIGEADDLAQSKDPSPVISADAASGSSPRDCRRVRQHRESALPGSLVAHAGMGPSTRRDLHFREVLAPLRMTGFDSGIHSRKGAECLRALSRNQLTPTTSLHSQRKLPCGVRGRALGCGDRELVRPGDGCGCDGYGGRSGLG